MIPLSSRTLCDRKDHEPPAAQGLAALVDAVLAKGTRSILRDHVKP